MHIVINGQGREIAELTGSPTVADLVSALGLKSDRVAIEQNGDIVPRGDWGTASVSDGDKFEIVHFVGGGVHP
jgi:thiamine biosynthesis protein ThiS